MVTLLSLGTWTIDCLSGVAQEIKLTGVIRFKTFSCFYLSRLFEPHGEMEMGWNYSKAKKEIECSKNRYSTFFCLCDIGQAMR